MTPPLDQLVAELAELIAIPSISADAAHAGDVRAAGEWICKRIRSAGGRSELVLRSGRPLAIGEIPASDAANEAPTVLCYGHFDVQPPDPIDLWQSPPFELVRRDGWLVARGVVDDKGQVFMLLKAVELLAAAGELPVNVRFAFDGEEEVGGHSIVEWIEEDEQGANAAVVFDGSMLARDRPAFDVAVRGMAYFHVRVRTGERDLHSGLYGGAALNAVHALMETLAGVVARDGRLPEPLYAGVVPPGDVELAGWSSLPSGESELTSQGARPMDERAAQEYYLRTWAAPAVDVNGIEGGSPRLQKTVLPVEAQANVSIRLAPGQEPAEIAAVFERLLRAAAPEGATVEVELWSSSPPGLVPTDAPAVQLGLDAFEHVLGVRPLLIRSGGSIPIVPALSKRGITALVTGFGLADSNIHAPNERLPDEYLPLGVETAQELFRRLARLA